MDLKNIAAKILGYDGPPSFATFTLDETEEEQQLAADGSIAGDVLTGKKLRRSIKKPKKVSPADTFAEEPDEWAIRSILAINKQRVEGLFHLPLNKDVVIREFVLGNEPQVNAFLVFVEGMADKQVINNFILQPLMLLSNLDKEQGQSINLCQRVLRSYLPSNQVKEVTNFQEVIAEVTTGSTVIFVDGCPNAIAAETKGFAHRSVEAARTEQVVQGPQEGFVENLRSNTTLIRRIIHSANLVTEYLPVGERNRANVAILYLADLVNPKLVKEVKRRLSSVKVDYIADTGMLEEMIEDYPFSLIPQTIKTERPDRVASLLVEGKVAIAMDNNPFVIVVPAVFFDFIHSPEDHYVRFPYGMWLRFIRVIALFITLLLPAFYVAIATFHQEMIPTDLLLTIAASEELVPFPTIVEILLMEFSFELIREAGVRVPGIIGPTLGIVGTLILGQAAVAASIVSPILIIIVAVTGLASFAIPSYTVAFGFRSMRFIFIFLAALLGFFGISTGLFLLLCLIISMKSFGVPFFVPIAPRTGPSPDVILRYPVWQQELRPDYLQPRDRKRQPNISRSWAKKTKH